MDSCVLLRFEAGGVSFCCVRPVRLSSVRLSVLLSILLTYPPLSLLGIVQPLDNPSKILAAPPGRHAQALFRGIRNSHRSVT